MATTSNVNSVHDVPRDATVLIFEPEVRRRLGGIAHSTLWRMVRADEFPPPIKVSKRRIAWYVDVVEEFLRSRPIADAYRARAAAKVRV
jgi:predicted DNA-binding transcriptional regulator AlpA